MVDVDRWKQIGERIGALIRLRGYTSVELFAHENGLDKSVLNRLINGKREVRLSTFLKIADALEIGMEALEGRAWCGKPIWRRGWPSRKARRKTKPRKPAF